jgi:transcriptional antiterminator RfaH
LHKIRFTRGVCSVVSFGGDPTPVDDYIIRTLKERANGEGLVNLYDELEPGNKVTIVAGPFKDFTGVFERNVNDAQRVMILMQTVNYQTHVVLERELVQRV